jgi:hypothetical protein
VVKELAELNRIRLDEDLSIATLALGIGIDPSALHRLLFLPNRQPWDRTLHKVRRFLAARKAAQRAAKQPSKAKGRAA